jgi:hypothetical protein
MRRVFDAFAVFRCHHITGWVASDSRGHTSSVARCYNERNHGGNVKVVITTRVAFLSATDLELLADVEDPQYLRAFAASQRGPMELCVRHWQGGAGLDETDDEDAHAPRGVPASQAVGPGAAAPMPPARPSGWAGHPAPAGPAGPAVGSGRGWAAWRMRACGSVSQSHHRSRSTSTSQLPYSCAAVVRRRAQTSERRP